jgi:23S rRNA (pseudouridine1915-N3)-methyltransferase
MKLRILAVGRARSGPESALIAEYQKRLHWPLAIEEVEEKRPLSGAELKSREGALLQAAIERAAAKAGGRPLVVALDERGKTLGSRDFAARLKGWEDQGAPEILFLLGGADGLAPDLRGQANLVLSLGQMTWPHLLARVMLVEQIYRAQQILAGHPYHRD